MPAAQCEAGMTAALARLRDARELFEICSCYAAEALLRRWIEGQRGVRGSCAGRAAALNAVAREALRLAEGCY